jgi:hypothetical protein
MTDTAVQYPAIDTTTDEWKRLYAEWIERQAASAYGWASAFLLHPEIGPLLRKAAQEGWTQQYLENEIRKTQWWQTTTESQRAWDQITAADPATATARVDQNLDDARTIVSQLGGTLDEDVLRSIVTRSLRDGWDQQQLTTALAGELLRTPEGTTQVRAGVVGRSLSEIAYNYGVPISQATLDSWAAKIAVGTVTMDDFSNWVRNQASGMYPSLADDIQRGMTVKDLTEPYAQVAARVLGLTPEQVDFTDPKWNVALNYSDPSTGTRRTLNLFEWATLLRKDPAYGYEYTPDAIEKAYALADMIAHTFGKI